MPLTIWLTRSPIPSPARPLAKTRATTFAPNPPHEEPYWLTPRSSARALAVSAVNGLEYLSALAERLQVCSARSDTSPRPGSSSVARAVAFELLDPTDHQIAVFAQELGRSFCWPQINRRAGADGV
jgi:hypothetical protein